MGVASSARDRARLLSSVEELALLVESAGAQVVGQVLQERKRKDPATLIGRGKVEEVAAAAKGHEAGVVVFDDELSPAQQRNLEEQLSLKTLDRTQLILDIFARRARTMEGRMQVELAQLDYLLPRLAGKGVLLSRLGGGIGTRGPGETKLETDRRRIRQRIQSIKRDIERVRRNRSTRREARQRGAAPVVALVGYTNAGKSTLFNALTGAETAISDQLFMTLDPLVRRMHLGPRQDVLLVDTVGFIQKLPHALVAAFRATLEEVAQADLLLHVMDLAAEDMDEREAAVEAVLREIGAAERQRIVVLNKVDLVGASRARAEHEARPDSVLVSARSGAFLADLRETVAQRLTLLPRSVRLRFPAGDRRGIAGVYIAGRVLEHHVDGDHVMLDAEIPERMIVRFRGHIV